MREIILDTETTGLDPKSGHKIVEIGCVEMIDRVKTGKFFHAYINPMRDVPTEAFRVHGLSEEFLRDKPIFEKIAEEFLDFIQDSRLVIHNARFDMKFINHELSLIEKQEIPITSAIDTLLIARKKFPGSPANLDALCKKFKIDLSKREKHGALLDAELLAEVYIELQGGAQTAINFQIQEKEINVENKAVSLKMPARKFEISEEDQENHQKLLKQIKSPIWENN